ncbi:MAG: hypothetical protein LBQ31_05520 [Bacteroidales bacterium]|jgi:hypothetical protein|nr:hypothetical protein [Bacteroidales bacterium]
MRNKKIERKRQISVICSKKTILMIVVCIICSSLSAKNPRQDTTKANSNERYFPHFRVNIGGEAFLSQTKLNGYFKDNFDGMKSPTVSYGTSISYVVINRNRFELYAGGSFYHSFTKNDKHNSLDIFGGRFFVNGSYVLPFNRNLALAFTGGPFLGSSSLVHEYQYANGDYGNLKYVQPVTVGVNVGLRLDWTMDVGYISPFITYYIPCYDENWYVNKHKQVGMPKLVGHTLSFGVSVGI